jgi:hypothetical protein
MRDLRRFSVLEILKAFARSKAAQSARTPKPGGVLLLLLVLTMRGFGAPAVTAPPESFFEIVSERDREAARGFYKKYIDVKGMPVVAADVVADEALVRTYEIVTHLLAGRPDVLEAMVKNKMYLIIIGKDQVYTDMPEYRRSPNPAYQNERVRGTGGKPTSFGEENLLSLPLDRYDDESIGVHEFCHTIDSTLRSIDTSWPERKNAVYRKAMEKGLWKNTYAASNPGEFWAEICQSYFDCNRVNNWNHGPVGTREHLKEYDPESYELVRATFNLSASNDWRYSFMRKLPNVMAPPAKFHIDPYYTKFTWAREFPVVGREASDESLLRANNIMRKMFAYRHDILKAFINDGWKLAVLKEGEKNPVDAKMLSVIEGRDSELISLFAKNLYDLTGKRPVDPNWENRGREVQQYELRVKRMDMRFDEKLKAIHGRSSGPSKAAADYWADGVVKYFSADREQLKNNDPQLYDLVHETMAYEGHVDWRLGR